MDRNKFIEDELAEVGEKCTEKIHNTTIEACVPAMVRVRIRKTKHKDLTVCIQFTEQYPSEHLVVELKSKTLPDKFLDGLSRLCEKEAADKHVGRRQVLLTIKFIRNFIEENPLCVCSGEISRLKKLLTDTDECKLKQKSGTVNLKLFQGAYCLDVRIAIPDDYPLEPIGIDFKSCNFPSMFERMFKANAIEIARQCIEPPMRKKPKDPPFEPKPSLYPVTEYLIMDCVKYSPVQICALCKQKCFPDDPKNVITDMMADKYVERVYCGHLFHFGCMDAYMKVPPFVGGKICPFEPCGKRIYHDKWRASPELAEARWAHQQARERELAEVVDFLD